MRVQGLTPNKLYGLALDAGMKVEWMAKTPRRSKGFFRLVPIGKLYETETGDACVHGYRRFICLCFERGATLVETALRDYEALSEVKAESTSEILAEIEERYGPQVCACVRPRERKQHGELSVRDR